MSDVHPDVLEMQPDATRWWHNPSGVSIVTGTATFPDGKRWHHISVTWWPIGTMVPQPASDAQCASAFRGFGQRMEDYVEKRTAAHHIARNFLKEIK